MDQAKLREEGLIKAKETTCILCQSKKIIILKKIKIFNLSLNLVKCNVCDLVFVDPLPRPKYLESYYNEKYYDIFTPLEEKDNFIRRILKEILFRIKFLVSTVRARSQIKYILRNVDFDKKENSDRKVLDVGCGNCALLSIFHKLNWQIFGVEPSKYFARQARRRFNFQNIFAGSLQSYKLSNQKFDVITICHILEHVIDPIEILKKAKGLLKEKGVIFIEVRSIHDKSRNIFKRTPRDELYFYSKDTLKKMLETNNFSLVSIDSVDTVELTTYPIMENIGRSIRNFEPVNLLINLFLFMKISIIVFLAYLFKYDHARYPSRENIAIRALLSI